MAARSDDGDAYVKLEEGTRDQPATAQQELQQACSRELGNPCLYWPVLVFSLFIGGTSGPVMDLMRGANPIALVGWRHQVSSLVMLPGFIYEGIKMDASKRKRFLSLTTLLMHVLTASIMAAHYATYSMALRHTSMPHCLFLINTSPVFMALFVKLSGGILHPLELGGILMSLLGIAIFAVGNALDSSDNSSHYGDFLAIVGAVFVALYLSSAKPLRSWMPLFVYQCPVAIYNMIILGIGGWMSKRWLQSDEGAASGPFDWLNKDFWWQTVYLGAACGVLGQAGYSYVLKYAAPLVLPTGFTIQPVIGSVLSWIIGQTAVPTLSTWIGGVAILIGTTVVNVASVLKKATAEI